MKYLIAGLLMLLSFGAHATAQRADIIFIDDERYFMFTNPLAPWIATAGWEPPDDAVITSANWRGYVAHWKIEDDRLMLDDITIELRNEDSSRKRVSIMNDVFPEQERVPAKWYSGVLVIPDGELVKYVHMGYGSTYSHYQIIRVQAGVVTDHRKLDYDEFLAFNDEKFAEFQKTAEYQAIYEEIRSDSPGLDEEDILGFIRSLHAEYYLSL